MGRNKVATWKRRHDIGKAPGETVSRPWLGGHDLEWTERCRDTNLISLHGLASRRLRPGNDVATWHGTGQG